MTLLHLLRLYSNMTLSGSGVKTVLKKCGGFRSKFSLDADYGELQVKVADASGFREGMAVAVYDDDQRTGWASHNCKNNRNKRKHYLYR